MAVQQLDHGWEEAVPEPVCACIQVKVQQVYFESLAFGALPPFHFLAEALNIRAGRL